MKKQVLVIHGGDTFESHDEWLNYLNNKKINFERIKNPQPGWKDNLVNELSEEFDVIIPKMPNKQNASYEEWRIWFGRTALLLDDGVILVGHSLGGIFLAKYLSENDFPKDISATFLVSAPYDDKESEYTLADFSLGGDLSKFREQAGKIYLIQSKDDPVVPFEQLSKYKESLPEAETVVFDDKEHFSQEEFPEIVELIKKQG
ncbi:MAG: alpha/beta hydrolase [Candidatus Paceibacterota bacterium]